VIVAAAIAWFFFLKLVFCL